MKQKFQNLGLILSKDAQKKLIGGTDDPSGIIDDSCGSCTWGDTLPNKRACTKNTGVLGGCDCPGGAYSCVK
ncbi:MULTISPECIES: hypothetical protein [Sediminibacterium]|jgi:hypothetical protein|uniref:hypothetical protein n=1 Tax=Sediminibacterium TaxID=504481 RepID=UPI00047BA8E5|nr:MULTISPECIES: hypothetical protein [Sediminibacterium]MDO8996769.1 hypothetical protein [Sediminibacterium sp.]MDP1971680.1 hypothetical protein [Sediminibacterium sp.]MDP2421311.1 hypothetical protein [Sediminibacterium sp.]